MSALGFPFGFRVAGAQPLDEKYGPYISVAEAIQSVLPGERYIGLTVNVAGVEYWWKDGVTDFDLIKKSSASGLAEVLIDNNDGGNQQIKNVGNPTELQDVDTLAARNEAISNAIDALKENVPAQGNTLAKLYTLITAIGRPRGVWDASNNTVPSSVDNQAGDFWRISVGGTLDNLLSGSGIVKPGDILFADEDGATNKNQFYCIQSNVDQATNLALGLVKLYTDLVEANTDGTVTQSVIKNAIEGTTWTPLQLGNVDYNYAIPFDIKRFITIHFTASIILSQNVINGKLLMPVVIKGSGMEPTFDASFKRIGGIWSNLLSNYIRLIRISENEVHYEIYQL
ncbi:MAG: hypothetical protein O9340_12100 [Cyclobacteriaceae bacterium]|jgi:hypothetical protein|nr:hypothetical protein [Cyclobacteriaceae bacterium]